jgi:probable DNA repair protein
LNGRRPHPALAAIGPGTLVVTANNRLARALHGEWGGRAQADGLVQWETPDILPWPAWLQREWEALLYGAAVAALPEPCILLNRLQEHALWCEVVRASAAGSRLLRPEATAHLAAEARQLQYAWALPVEALVSSAPGPDVNAFLAWSRAFEARCRERGWIDGARLPDVLARAYQDGVLRPPPHLYCAGFDDITPQQRALLRAVEAAGAAVQVEEADEAPPSAAVLQVCDDALDEIRAAAHWARSRLEQTGAGVRIAIVVPDLAAHRAAVLRIMDDVLSPCTILPGNAAQRAPYNVSLGLPIAAYPPVHAALTALDMLAADPPLARAGALLRSPFFAGGESEMGARGLLDARLRERGEAVVTTGLLASMAAEEGSHACPLLAAALARWQRAARALPASLSPGAWAERLLQLLHLLGWPGERPLDSEEYQLVDTWRQLVCSLAGLDQVLPALTLDEVLAWLRRLSAEQVFQPAAEEEAPVQVMGVLEAAGMHFDHVRVLGLHDGVWPPVPDPNPFLPFALQRRLGLPRSGAERELELARRITERLQRAAPEVCFSHAALDGDRALRVSPLLAHLPVVTAEAATPPAFYYRQVQASARLETLDDTMMPAYPEGEAPGGARLFQLQAACPFRAGAELRLHARPLAEATVGAAASERGTLMHEVLDRLWRALGDSATLHELDGPALEALLVPVVDEALQYFAARRPRLYTRKFREVERWRLLRRLREWLQVESRRASFAVEQTETQRVVHIGGLEVKLRIDRLDRLPDGGCAVIDYKTGAVSLEAWFGERPDEPQLPLYSLTLGDELRAILFACLRPGSIGYVGVARAGDVMPGTGGKVRVYGADGADGAWEAQRRDWERAIGKLAEDFRAGVAAVDPKRYPSTCAYCGLTALCRINDATDIADDGEDAA